MTKVSDRVWLNGSLVQRDIASPSIASINLHLGTSVFDGLMAYRRGNSYYLHRVNDHLDRFKSGAKKMGLDFPWSTDELAFGISELLVPLPSADYYIRPIAYRRGPELWVTGSEGKPVDVCMFAVQVDREIGQGVSCHISPIERISSRSFPQQIKVSGAYVNSFYARKTAELHGYLDGIMLDRQGFVAEASAANIFVIGGGSISTPKLGTDVFPGITRKVILELAQGLGLQAKEVNLRPTDLLAAQGAFLCSTLMEIRAITRIDSRDLHTTECEEYVSVVRAFSDLVLNS